MVSLRLSLIRHAKAEAESSGSEGDHGRPLSAGGRRDAVAMARRLAEQGFEPDRILSSTARRARQTSELLARGLDCEPRLIVPSDELYLAEPAELVSCIRACDAEIRHLALVGHNPGLGEAWGWLTAAVPPALPTCAVVLLDTGVENWCQVDSSAAKLIDFLRPATRASLGG